MEIHEVHTRGYAVNYTAYLQQKELFLQTLADRIDKCEKEIKRLTGALQSMKRANKYDKSISQKHQMLSRSQRHLKWLKKLKPKERRGLQFNLQSTEKSSLDVLDFKQASLKFEGLKRPILNKVDIGVRRGQKIGIVGAGIQGVCNALFLQKKGFDMFNVGLGRPLNITQLAKLILKVSKKVKDI